MAEHIHDKGYKSLFSEKKNFLAFLKKYINLVWVNNIDERDLTLVDKSFVDSSFREKESDVIYRLKTSEGEIYFYVILELQSSVDNTMPLRLLTYKTNLINKLFYDTDVRERTRKEYRLPAVVPIVLYNGDTKWSVPTNFREYVNYPDFLEQYVIDFKYDLVALNAIEDDEIYNTNTLVDNIFALDKVQHSNDAIRTIKVVFDRMRLMEPDDQLVLMDWIRNVLQKTLKQEALVEQVIEAMEKGDDTMEYALERVFKKERQTAKNEASKETRNEIAKKMLQSGMDPALIVQLSGLTLEDLKKLNNAAK